MTLVPLLPMAWGLALVGGLGLVVGSFLNVVVHRVPAGLSVINPPSACPACRHEVRARDNVPVLSWVLLRGRCRDCANPISWRYPAVEAATGVAFALTAWRVGEPVVLVPALVVVAAGIALALIDLEHQRLPFAITGIAGALVALSLVGGVALGATPPAVLPLLVSVGLWTGVYATIWFVSAGRGMGLGDVALAPVLGLALGALGAGASLVGLAAGFVLGAFIGGALLASGKVTRGSRVPHGPFMLAGAAVALLAGAPIADAYLRLVGLR